MKRTMTATYSPEDNKLRLYTVNRLDAETYARLKTAGFRWAPKQDLFVAPAWTPERADLLEELCGEIGDEDTSLVDRAEERAERFEEYSERRAADARAAGAEVERIAGGIPLGQPILVGHHSERRARRDAERIRDGMKKAVKMWETSEYWTRRAQGAVRLAKYKERPDVRYRRIKTIEADRRKQEKRIAEARTFLVLWSKDDLTRDKAIAIANYDHVYLPSEGEQPHGESLWSALRDDKIDAARAAARAIECHKRTIARAERWIAHLDNRLDYERAMLGESGGVAADKFQLEVGGRVLCREWYRSKGYLTVLRVNRKGGAIVSVSVSVGDCIGVVNVEKIEDYRPPEPGAAEKVKKATKLPPLVNYPGEGFRHMTRAEWDRAAKHSDFYRIARLKASATRGAHRRREAPMEGGPYYKSVGVYITDAKRVDPPPPEQESAEQASEALAPEPVAPELLELGAPRPRPERTVFDDMRETLKSGVAVVSAPQLFPTPPDLAARMVALAGVEAGHRVLEPSAGTGSLLREIQCTGAEVVAVEINPKLATTIGARCADFLACADLGDFDRIVMNPPFERGQDVAHVAHAYGMLRDGGVLVSVMSAGVKFRDDAKTRALRALVEARGEVEDLPEDTFRAQGTGVRTVLVTLRK